MNKLKVESMAQFDTLIDEGYTESIEDMARYLRISSTKARGLLKHAFRIELSERLYHEYKKDFNTKVSRSYYDKKQTFKYLLSNGLIKVYFHDPRQAFTNNVVDREIRIENDYLFKDMFMTKILFNVSMSITDIIIMESEYSFFAREQYKGKIVDWYIDKNDDSDLFSIGCKSVYEDILKTKEDIFSKSEYVKYTNMIKRGFYIRFQVGKSNNRYIHSINQLKESEQKSFIIEWIKEKASDK